MRPSLRARIGRALLRKHFKSDPLTVARARALGEGNASLAALAARSAPGTKVEWTLLAGLRSVRITPPGAAPGRALLWLHGGGYVAGSAESELMMFVPMARALGLELIAPDYRLAPEHPFPAALEDALAVWRALLAGGLQSGRVVLGGDSAGGGLALAAAVALRDSGEPMPAALLCLSPWADLLNRGISRAARAARDPVLGASSLELWASLYAGGSERSDPRMSVLDADLRGLPPLLLQVGSEEILLDDSLALARRAADAGIDVELRVWEGMWHVWPLFGEILPESGEAFREMADFLRRRPGGDILDPEHIM